LDDKILTGWNGMMLASLAEAARVLDRTDYRAAAIQNAMFLLQQMRQADGRLFRSYKDGVSKINATLEDYGCLIDGLLEVYQTTFDLQWFEAARSLCEFVLGHFAAPDGGFFDTSDDHEALIVRPRNMQDNAVPSGNAMMARNLIRLAAYTREARYEAAATGTLALLTEAMRQYPNAFGEGLSAADMLVGGVDEVAVVGDPTQAETRALLEVIQKPYRPNVVTALSPDGVVGAETIPLLRDRTAIREQPTAYVCRRFVCQMPVTTTADTARLLDGSRS
jgi:uncharacterized protein YyaL (SSP411 family)